VSQPLSSCLPHLLRQPSLHVLDEQIAEWTPLLFGDGLGVGTIADASRPGILENMKTDVRETL